MSIFQLSGGAGDPINKKISTTSEFLIAEAPTGNSRISVPIFRCTEVTGATPSLAVYIELADGTKTYLRAAQNMTAYQSLLFDDGYLLLPGMKLYALADAANKIDVIGVTLVDNT